MPLGGKGDRKMETQERAVLKLMLELMRTERDLQIGASEARVMRTSRRIRKAIEIALDTFPQFREHFDAYLKETD